MRLQMPQDVDDFPHTGTPRQGSVDGVPSKRTPGTNVNETFCGTIMAEFGCNMEMTSLRDDVHWPEYTVPILGENEKSKSKSRCVMV